MSGIGIGYVWYVFLVSLQLFSASLHFSHVHIFEAHRKAL
jgi:hypothetical protein